jgi:2-dehydro-3-deoxygluconokinase
MQYPDLLCLGEPLFEFSQLPDTEAGQADYLSGFGGDVSNFAIAAAKQGANVGMLCHLGQDAFGDAFMKLWREQEVNTEFVKRDPKHPTGSYYIHHTPDGHEFSFSRKGSAASMMTPSDLPKTAIEKAKLLHVTAISQAISSDACDSVFAAIDIAKQSNTLVSYDTNLRLKLWPLERAKAIILHTIGLVDICLPSVDEAELLTGLTQPDDILDYYLLKGAKNIVLKLGEKGAMFASNDERFKIGPHLAHPVDATAAGDSFAGAFCQSWIKGRAPKECLRYANATASITIEGYGAVAPLPNHADVEKRLAEPTLEI